MPVFVLEPAAQYHHSYARQVIERVLPLDRARQACAQMGLSSDGYSGTIKQKCFIVIPRGGPVPDLHAYRRHERADCNGWDHARSDR
jgi:hypothetical protein